MCIINYNLSNNTAFFNIFSEEIEKGEGKEGKLNKINYTLFWYKYNDEWHEFCFEVVTKLHE